MKADENNKWRVSVSYETALLVAERMNGCKCLERMMANMTKEEVKKRIYNFFWYALATPYAHDCPENKCKSCNKTSPIQLNPNGSNWCPFCGIKIENIGAIDEID